jgi:hypothetical protein
MTKNEVDLILNKSIIADEWKNSSPELQNAFIKEMAEKRIGDYLYIKSEIRTRFIWFAKGYNAANAAPSFLDEALNSGDGSYKP